MTSDALSPWDRERLATARKAYEEAIKPPNAMQDPDLIDHAILAAIRAAEGVKPPPDQPKALARPAAFFRKLEGALSAFADPGTAVDTSNGSTGTWQDYWVTVEGAVWFISCRPNKRYVQLPLAPAPERYNSLGQPSVDITAGEPGDGHREVVEQPDQAG